MKNGGNIIPWINPLLGIPQLSVINSTNMAVGRTYEV